MTTLIATMPSQMTLPISDQQFEELKKCSTVLQDMADEDDDIQIESIFRHMNISEKGVHHILQKKPVIISQEGIDAADKLHVQPYLNEAAENWISTRGSFAPNHCITMSICVDNVLQYRWKDAMRTACKRGDDLTMINLWIDELAPFCVTLWSLVSTVRTAAVLYQKKVPFLQHNVFRFTDDPSPPESLMDVFEYLLIKKYILAEYMNDLFFRACQKGSTAAVEILLINGANLHHINAQRNTCLYYAADQDTKKMFNFLVNKGALLTPEVRSKLIYKQMRRSKMLFF